jgi:hypothetical protein
MTVKASAAGALMLAAGLFLSIAGPSPAKAAGSESAAASKPESATSEKSTKSSSRYLKKKRHAHRKYSRTAAKPAETDKAAEKAGASPHARPAMSESAANAYAQMNSADAAQGGIGDSAKAMSQAMSTKANTILLAAADNQADGQAPAEGAAVAPPEQLNAVDKVLQESQSSQAATSQTEASQTATSQTVAMAREKPAQQDNSAQVSGSDSLDKTSLIGKIFIAFGTLLTMASAARMFMA